MNLLKGLFEMASELLLPEDEDEDEDDADAVLHAMETTAVIGSQEDWECWCGDVGVRAMDPFGISAPCLSCSAASASWEARRRVGVDVGGALPPPPPPFLALPRAIVAATPCVCVFQIQILILILMRTLQPRFVCFSLLVYTRAAAACIHIFVTE